MEQNFETCLYNVVDAAKIQKDEPLVMIVATILFLIVGVGLIGFGTINVYKNMKKNQSTDKDRNEE